MKREPREEGARWYHQAVEDLKWMKTLRTHDGGYHIICFLCQQIGEKALKAFLYAQGEEIVLGHSILKLTESAGRYDESFHRQSSRWSPLDNYYISSRYPNGIPDGIPADTFNEAMADEAISLADEILAAVNGRVHFD